MSPLIITLIALAVIIIGFASGKFSYALIAVVGLVILQVGKVLTPAETWSGFANTTMVLYVSLFVIGGGFTKTSLLTRMKSMLSGYQGNPRAIVWATMGAATLLSIFSGVIVAAATIIPVIISITEDNDKLSRTQILKPAIDISSMWSGTLPVGLGAGAYLLFNSIVENAGGVGNFTIMDSFVAKIIPLLACLIWEVLFGWKLIPKEPQSPLKEFGSAVPTAKLEGGALTTLTPFQDKMAIILYFGSVLGMIFVSFVPIVPTYIVAAVCAILTVLTGVLNEKEAFGSISWTVIFMYAGLLPLTTALQNSGVGQLLTDGLQTMLGGSTNPYFVTAVFFLIPAVATQFMMNSAVSAVFMALSAVVCVNLGMDVRCALLASVAASGCSVLTPMSCPPLAMLYGTGGYTMKSFFISGLPLFIIFFVVYVFTAPLFFPFF